MPNQVVSRDFGCAKYAEKGEDYHVARPEETFTPPGGVEGDSVEYGFYAIFDG